MRKFNINVNGQNYVVDVEEIGGTATTAPMAVAAAPVAAAPKAAPVAAGKGTPCPAPMPGLVKAHKVANGATVKKGEAVLVLEAMKMENDIAAHAAGVVTFVAAVGASVGSNEVLFTIA